MNPNEGRPNPYFWNAKVLFGTLIDGHGRPSYFLRERTIVRLVALFPEVGANYLMQEVYFWSIPKKEALSIFDKSVKLRELCGLRAWKVKELRKEIEDIEPCDD